MEENQENAQSTEIKTYLGLGNDEAGNIEFDLVSHREKGELIRYLSISINDKKINIDEDAFNSIKQFFQQLEWES